MQFKKASAALGLGALLVAGAGAEAVGNTTPALDFKLGMSARATTSATALTLHVVYKNPSDPNGKPSPLRKSVVQAPPGTAFDGHAIPACTVTDNQLMARGTSACPTDSRVGTGRVSLITGFGPPVDPEIIDAVLLNGGDGIIELFSDDRSGLRLAVGHAKFTAPNTLSETPARQPGGPPDGESAVNQVDFYFKVVRGPGGKAFITTPPRCPTGGIWTSRITATVAAGNTYTVTSTTPCRLAGTRPPIRVFVERGADHRRQRVALARSLELNRVALHAWR
jgi:hypothetical protein